MSPHNVLLLPCHYDGSNVNLISIFKLDFSIFLLSGLTVHLPGVMVINNYLPSAPKFGLIQTRMTWARIKLIVRILLLEKFLFKSKERMGDPLFGQIWIEQEKKFSRPMESMLNCRVDINPCSRSWSKASASQSCLLRMLQFLKSSL